MLQTIRNTRQIDGEPHRQWYFSHRQDLVVWFTDEGEPLAFQLAYGKYNDEHSIAWHPERGYSHYSVDHETQPGTSGGTPLLYPDGPFEPCVVIKEFLAESGEVPPNIITFVVDRLLAYDGPIRE